MTGINNAVPTKAARARHDGLDPAERVRRACMSAFSPVCLHHGMSITYRLSSVFCHWLSVVRPS